jgi:resuscitation-promoting factor RpfB
MKFEHLLAAASIFFLLACQPTKSPTITIIHNDQIFTLQTNERLPSVLIAQAGIMLNPNDRVLLNGLSTAPDQPITSFPSTLQIRRAVDITIVTPDGEHKLQSSAFTIGEALQEASLWLRAGDQVDQLLNSPISETPISILPSHEITIRVNGRSTQVLSSARNVGEALAEAGVPLIGLDYSLPAENEPIPADGQIRVVRVSESMQLAQKAIPFESDLQASADVPLDQPRSACVGVDAAGAEGHSVRE